MRIMNVKRAIIILLIIGIMVVVSGCVRGRIEPGEPVYQLKITVEVEEQINTDDGIYYIVFDYDESNMSVLGDTIEDGWLEEHYYVRYDSWDFELNQKGDGPEVDFKDGDKSDNNKGFWVTVDIGELSSEEYIYINVLTADDLDDTIYDSLDDYFITIDITSDSSAEEEDLPGDSEDGPDFDIIKVTAEITTP